MARSLFIEESQDIILSRRAPAPLLSKSDMLALMGWAGTIFALLGGAILSSNTQASAAAWLVMAGASALLLIWSIKMRAGSQVLLHGAYLLISLNGMINYIFV